MNKAAIADMKDRSLSGNYLTHGSALGSDCVVAFAFGRRKIGNAVQPGLSNQQMSSYLNRRYLNLPKIVQFEIAAALQATAVRIYRIEQHRQPGAYLDTREVAEQAKQIMDRHGWKKAIIIAHPYHMPRADAVCRKLGMDTVAPAGLRAIGFDPDSEQEWTRNAASCSENEAQAIDQCVREGWI